MPPETSPEPKVTASHFEKNGNLLTRIARTDRDAWRTLGWTARWLIMVRAPVLVMTLTAAATAILLALIDGHFPADRALVLVLGLVLAHATNNLINDWVDHHQGVDKDNYFRREYGTHVLEDKLVSPTVFAAITLATGTTALACGLYLVLTTSEATGWLLLAGACFVVFYTWPLKHLALGEVSVLLVWGPLMVAGGYFVLTNAVTLQVFLLSVISGIPPTVVILAKHMDKIEQDQQKSIQTLPVVIGLKKARHLSIGLLVLQWLLIGAIFELWLLCTLFSGPALWQLWSVLEKAPPASKPDAYPNDVWPLWYSASAFLYARNFGLTLVVSMLIGVIVN